MKRAIINHLVSLIILIGLISIGVLVQFLLDKISKDNILISLVLFSMLIYLYSWILKHVKQVL